MSFPFFRGVALLCLPIIGAQSALAGPGIWTSTGPEGGSMVEMAVDPGAPSTIFLNGGNGGIYKSTDIGVNWSPLNVAPHAGRFTSLRMNPYDADTLLVTSYLRVFRSTDGGNGWTALGGGLPVPGAINDIAFDPHSAGRIWVADESALYRSTDGGNTWVIQPTVGFSGYLVRVTADQNVADRLFGYVIDSVGDTQKLYRSTDGGANWTEVAGLASVQVGFSSGSLPIAFTSVPNTMLLGGNFTEIFRSADGGASFVSVGHVSLANARNLYALRAHPTLANAWFVAMETGLARTTDGGANYTAIGQGIGPSTGGTYNNGVAALYVDPGSPNTIYAGATHTGLFVTSNGGASWSRRNSGLRQAGIRALAVHPTQPLWVYAGYGDAFTTPSDGLFRSVDRGSTWFTASPTLEASGLRGFAIDTHTVATPLSTTMYAAGYGAAVFALDGGVRDGNAGIFKSTDGGATWATIDTGIPTIDMGSYEESYFRTARSVVLDPSSGGPPAGTGPLQTIYLAGSGTIRYDFTTGAPTVQAARIYKSTDAGANWLPSDTGLPIPTYDTSIHYASAVQVVPLVIDPVDTDTLYVGTIVNVPANGSPVEPLISDGVVNGIFKSTDGGATWVHSSNGLPRLTSADPDSPHRSVLAMAIAPSAPATLYAAVNREMFDARVYKTTNGGVTWTEASDGIAPDADIRVLIVDPNDAGIAYAGSTGSETNPGGVYRTVDGGVTWTSYSVGLPSSAALALELDKSGAIPRLYAGTRNGVFSIDQVPDEDTDGVPTTTEAGAPSGGDGNGDGIPDTVQPRVASLPGADDALRGGTGYLSIELVPIDGACARLENTHALTADRFPPDPGREAAFGFVRMDVGDCQKADLELTYHGAGFDPTWVFRIYAPLTPAQTYTYAWRDFPFTRTGNVWTVTLTDNLLGDLRTADGAILFQGGVVQSERIFDNGFDIQ